MKRMHAVLAALSCIALAACSGDDAPSAPQGPVDAGTRDSADGAGQGLAAYVGKYPFDEVDGATWEKNQQVIDGVQSTVTDPAIAKRVLDYTGPAAPIAMIDGMVVAGVCEAHDCSDHNWEIFIDPANGATQVCYHDQARTPGRSIWFLPGGKREERDGACAIK
ncbi:MAG: hypothetical protein KGL48_14335 [Sphingomonadales bacterium]|nr:hypothetical protein [Sphingomonadales bacterium]MDE2569240.1 hypothetical protein [Sphingomonadales bacterium]